MVDETGGRELENHLKTKPLKIQLNLLLNIQVVPRKVSSECLKIYSSLQVGTLKYSRFEQ